MPSSRLAAEIGKRHPFESLEQEAHLNLVRTAATLSAAGERLFREAGLCGAHYNILRILAGEKAGGREGVPVLVVRERLISPLPDITRLVDKLVAQKLVRRAGTAQDRRVVLLHLTAAGAKLVDRFRAPLAELHRQQLGHLSREDLRALIGLLEKARTRPD